MKLFGPAGEELSSGDDVADKASAERFAKRLRKMTNLVKKDEGTVILYVGAENWPFPVPLASEDGRWRFDTEAGRQEILRRRIGHDEAAAVRVCESADGVPDEEPLHGYYFRVVPARAGRPSAGDVTFVAYPAEYRATGAMTFVVTRDGAVWEKDLGPDTPSVASRLTSRASGWHAVEAHG